MPAAPEILSAWMLRDRVAAAANHARWLALAKWPEWKTAINKFKEFKQEIMPPFDLKKQLLKQSDADGDCVAPGPASDLAPALYHVPAHAPAPATLPTFDPAESMNKAEDAGSRRLAAAVAAASAALLLAALLLWRRRR